MLRLNKITLSPEAKEVYDHLKQEAATSKTERTIINAIHKKAELIKIDYTYGNPIAKRLIPKEYIIKYDINNLFRVELPSFWRMLYTLTYSND